MKKYILGCSFLIIASYAEAYECKLINTDCFSLGYVVTSNCPGNFLVCPFNASVKRCDLEGEAGDFKFSLIPPGAYGWEMKDWNKAYVVGASTSQKYCSVDVGKTGAEQVLSYTHGFSGSAKYSLGTNHTVDKGNGNNGNISVGSRVSESTVYNETSAASSAELRPISFRVRGYMYTSTLTLSNSGIGVSLPTNPDCSTLGYIHTINQCPGTYTVCPMDSSKVLCDLQAQAGEIKFSLQGLDHDGWLRVNSHCWDASCYSNNTEKVYGGRKLSAITSARGGNYTKSQLASILKDVQEVDAVNTKLPNYTAVFFQLTTSTSPTVYGSLLLDSVGTHKHKLAYDPQNTSFGAEYTSISVDTGFPVGKDNSEGLVRIGGSEDLDTDTYASSLANTSLDETRPANYAANIFIYSGLLE